MSVGGWRIYKIGELGRVVTGKTPSTQDLKNFGDKYPFITPRDMTGKKKNGQCRKVSL
jgi:type I restriction enzyme S subunit